MAGCGKYFADRTNVKRHEMIHSGQRPYWCTEQGCKRGYFWRKHLRKHMLSVHGVSYEQSGGGPGGGGGVGGGVGEEEEDAPDEMDEEDDEDEDDQKHVV